MKFKELIDNPSLENQIKFKKQQIERQKEDIKLKGDNGYGYKKILLENMEEDLEKLENDYKRINKQKD